MATINITGSTEAQQLLNTYPIEAVREIRRAMLRAGSQGVRELKATVRQRTFRQRIQRKLKEYSRANGSVLSMLVGYMDSKNADSHFAYMKAYWANYGTLDRRDPSHKFANKRKARSARWTGGINPQHFFEAGAKNLSSKVEGAYYEAIDNINRAYNEH